MVTRRRLASLVVLLLVGSGGAAAAVALAPQRAAVQQPAPVERVHRFFAEGPTASYTSDLGSIGNVRPLRFEVPGTGQHAGVLEVSFTYRTRGEGPFRAAMSVGRVGGRGKAVRPDQVVLAPARGGTTTTVRFLAPDLRGGRAYEATFTVDTVVPESGVNRISTRKVLLTVEMS